VSDAEQQPPPEPTAEQLVAELQKAKTADLVVHSCSLFASLAYGKLVGEARDIDDARLAIEALKVLSALVPEEAATELRGVLASLQLAYAAAAVPAEPTPPESGEA
jgi:hypothetical protein